MRFQVGNKTYQVVYRYSPDQIVIGNQPVEVPAVFCFIHEVLPSTRRCEDGVERRERVTIGTGTSHCSPDDHYDKVLGRTIATQRALEDAGFDRSATRTFWKAWCDTGHRINYHALNARKENQECLTHTLGQ